MTPALQALKNMLACVTYSGDQHSNAQIKENDPSAHLKTVNIQAPNGDWFVFAPDKGRGRPAKMSPLLIVGGDYQHHRACDAVIAVLKGDILQLIFIDLKSSAPGGYAGQFQSTRQFARYLLGLLEEFHEYKFQQVEERFILFHTAKTKKILLNKTPSLLTCQHKPSSDPRKPQKEVVTDGVTLYLKQLVL